jgi:hypothetical protein
MMKRTTMSPIQAQAIYKSYMEMSIFWNFDIFLVGKTSSLLKPKNKKLYLKNWELK